MVFGSSDETRFLGKDYPPRELEQRVRQITKLKLGDDFPIDPKVKPYGEDKKVDEVLS